MGFEKVDNEYRWGRLTVAPWRWAMCIYKCNDHWGVQLFFLWIKLGKYKVPPPEIWESWGWYYCQEELFSSLHLNWGHGRCKIIDMPWSWNHIRHEYMLKAGGFVEFVGHEVGSDAYKRHFPYVYTLKSGEVQNRVAEVTVERRTWKSLWRRKVSMYIDVRFDQEVGERTGSWKGGTLGCGYDLGINETPYECLKRMEKERKFG